MPYPIPSEHERQALFAWLKQASSLTAWRRLYSHHQVFVDAVAKAYVDEQSTPGMNLTIRPNGTQKCCVVTMPSPRLSNASRGATAAALPISAHPVISARAFSTWSGGRTCTPAASAAATALTRRTPRTGGRSERTMHDCCSLLRHRGSPAGQGHRGTRAHLWDEPLSGAAVWLAHQAPGQPVRAARGPHGGPGDPGSDRHGDPLLRHLGTSQGRTNRGHRQDVEGTEICLRRQPGGRWPDARRLHELSARRLRGTDHRVRGGRAAQRRSPNDVASRVVRRPLRRNPDPRGGSQVRLRSACTGRGAVHERAMAGMHAQCPTPSPPSTNVGRCSRGSSKPAL